MPAFCPNSNIFSRCNHDRGLVALSYLIIFSLFSLVLFYLFQTNSLVSYSYEIREQEKSINKMKDKNHWLEMEAARLQSPLNLEEIIKPLGMVEMKEAIYLSQEKEVAVKK